MKINKDNFENFYFGNACESFIQSELYALGYEVSKTSPDIGYDLLVTNCARTKFLGEEPRQYNIQVKGRVCYKDKVDFYIDEDDYDMLLNDKNSYWICVFCFPIIEDGRDNITEYRELDFTRNMGEEWAKSILSECENVTLKYLKEKNVPYVGFEFKYLWFNNAQLNRLKEAKYIFDNGENLKKICVSITESYEEGQKERLFSPIDGKGSRLETSELYGVSGGYAYEQSHVKYLVKCEQDDAKMYKGDRYL